MRRSLRPRFPRQADRLRLLSVICVCRRRDGSPDRPRGSALLPRGHESRLRGDGRGRPLSFGLQLARPAAAQKGLLGLLKGPAPFPLVGPEW